MRARVTVQQKDRRTNASYAEPDVTSFHVYRSQFEIVERHFIPLPS
jgi:hypothetical protein